MRAIAICLSLAALALAGCQTDGLNLTSGSSTPTPKTVVVTDFVYSPDVTIIDRGFTVRLSRKEKNDLPFHIRKQRTLARVNDEIVATIVTTVRAAGLDAVPGSPESVSLKDNTLIVRGRLIPGEGAGADKSGKGAGIGDGRKGVVADMSLEELGGFGKKKLTRFTAQPESGKVKVDLAAIAAALPPDSAAAGRLSPDVEAQTHALGRAIGDRIVAYAREQGWLKDAAPAVEPQKKEKKKAGV